MSVFVAGLSYKTAPVEVREQLAVLPSKVGCHACRLKVVGGLDEVVLLSTCNRVEIYGVAPEVNGNIKSIFQLLAKFPCDLRRHLYVHEGAAALQHLFTVASGLDSMVLGETEITGQVKDAYEKAQAARLTGGVLNRVFQKAFHAAKEIRTQSKIQRGATSVGSVAVELAEKIFRQDLSQQTTIILGAGQMGETVLRHLAKKGAKSILVSNRSFDRAEALARAFGGRAIRFDDRLAAMANADIVVASTGCPQVLLSRDEVEELLRRRRQRPLFLIDISVPRNIDPEAQNVAGAYLYNIDDLEAIVRQNVRLREQDLALCRAIIDRQSAALMNKLTGGKEKQHDLGLQTQPGWLPGRALALGGQSVLQ
ncbi:MAG: Glutamyl-tRNA reductase [Verrucomicrobiae bacterium]|nr:Glutamyl-tRNA reductase [Verrucomicrobiae bacterium]